MPDDEKTKELVTLFKDIHDSLRKSGLQLDFAFKKATAIGTQTEYSPDELLVFEAFTSRFERTVDILTQQAYKAIIALEREGRSGMTFIDRVNLMEKLRLCEKAEDVIRLRDLRNVIAHEYKIEELAEVFDDTLKLTPMLLLLISNVTDYRNSRVDQVE